MRLFVWFLPIGLVLFWWRFPRAATRSAVLRLLSVSLESGMSIGRILNALGREAGYWEKKQLTALADCFDGGMTVSQAVNSMGSYFPIEVQAELQVAEACGNVRETLKRTADEWEKQANVWDTPWERMLVYLAGMTIILWGVIAFLGMYIMPKFLRIAEDMNVDVNPGEGKTGLINGAFGISPWPGSIGRTLGWLDFGLMLIGCAVVLSTIPALFHWWSGQRYDSVWGGVISRIFPRRDTPLLLRVLRIPIQAGLSLKVALDELEFHHPQVSMRRKIQIINKELEAGGSVWDAMASLKLLNTRERGLIRTAEKRGHLPWVLSEMAETIEGRRLDRLYRLREFLQPAAVICFAIPVMGTAMQVIRFLLLMAEKS